MDLDLELCRIVGESADRLVSTQIYGSGGAATLTNRNLTIGLYDAARKLQGEPLTYLAAKALLERVKPRDTVIITTGFFDPPSMIAETDGPLGAALLARSLCAALDATPVFLTELNNIPGMTQIARAAGVDVIDYELARTTPFKAAIAPLPIDPERARASAKKMIATMKPAALISIEKPSPSPTGRYHTGIGIDVTDLVGKIDHIFNEARQNGVLTIGIGDGGNEVGLGNILNDVIEVIPTGNKIGAAVETDVLVIASIADWGSYAIEACLAAALHLPEALHTLEEERRATDAAARAGFIDAATGFANGWVDGTPPICSESMLELLRQMVDLRMTQRYRPGSMHNFPGRWIKAGGADRVFPIWAEHLRAQEDAYFQAQGE